jgi:AmmeMemoRadiSam system protein B/AmmeMemoRadiSam system protein A
MRIRLFFALICCASAVGAATRSAAVAGSFYTDDPALLRSQVKGFVGAAGGSGSKARAIVVPHAGYVFSGATAGKAFARLEVDGVNRVILLGPSHHVGFSGGALPDPGVSSFSTPLGAVFVDRKAVSELRRHADFDGPAEAHGPEHSIEVELPFLQVLVPEARIVPVLVGFETDRETALRMARAIREIVDERTVVVASSDFTHHGARYGYAPFKDDPKLGEKLVRVGRSTVDRVAEMDPSGFWFQVEVSGDTVCGRRPVAILTELLAHSFDGSGEVLGVTTSGHLTGSWDLSVTYAAVAFDGSWTRWNTGPDAPGLPVLQDAQGEQLISLARATLRSHLSHDASLARWFAAHPMDEALGSLAGAFVTLNNVGERARKEGRLRACMGVIEAREPLKNAVIHAAVSAAHDPRFPKLRLSELDELELEVSALSPTHRVPGATAIRVGKHGVVLTKAGRRAVFLPQVATEQGWDRDTMLDHLSRKAGLATDAWRRGADFEVFTAQVFSEEK